MIADYDKVHLFGLMVEDEYLQAGNKESVFELDDIKAASVICYDIRFPEWVRTLMSSGAKVLFVVAEWPKERVEQWEILLRARAVENQAFVVAVNRVGDGNFRPFFWAFSGDCTHWGKSFYKCQIIKREFLRLNLI